jgi:hypothetical protein
MMNRDPSSSSLFFTHEEKRKGDDDEPFSSSLSYAHVEKNAENDNDLGGLLSSSTI